AIEVGGDFYDIRNYDNSNLITIGDVSGHGVTPGLITMIIQTIISSIITQNKSIRVKDLYNYLNNILIEKIKKLDMRIYVTICLLKEIGNGNFRGCGKHNDIIIYRSEEKKIEIIETKGIWLGISEDISDYIQEYKFKLNKDDIMILYTDGLSEFYTDNGEMFGDKLKEFIPEINEKSSEEIVEKILDEFENFKKISSCESNNRDDVTLLVIKKL
ncbi:MAG: serine/threonine-protein phosphatase, partial [Exilispira sp.]|nr:serine/threonine-protein phosphatase [Exilispira sp.]